MSDSEAPDALVARAATPYLDDLSHDAAFDSLSMTERAAITGWVLNGLVRGDGFQGWIESIGQRAEATYECLVVIGADNYADLVGQAIQAAPGIHSPDVDHRLAEADLARLADLDRRYFALAKSDPLLVNYLAPFILSHPDELPLSVDDL